MSAKGWRVNPESASAGARIVLEIAVMVEGMRRFSQLDCHVLSWRDSLAERDERGVRTRDSRTGTSACGRADRAMGPSR
jgi:hypothetical protein